MNSNKIGNAYYRNITVVFFSALLISYGEMAIAESTATTYSISGSISGTILQGVKLVLSDGRTVTSDAKGNFTFTGLANGKYTVTPLLAVIKFRPTSTDVSINAANAGGADFTEIGQLNDTGITSSQCYQAGSDVLVDCRSAAALALNDAQDGMVGRDANPATNNNADGKLGFSFTSIPGGCVQDNITGLMWEVKTDDGGLRDWKNTYTNYDNASAPQKNPDSQVGETYRTFYVKPTQMEIDSTTNTIGFAKAVNSQKLCGYDNWRLPTYEELETIVDYGAMNIGASIDVTAFPNTQPDTYWSASGNGGHPQDARAMTFSTGSSSDLVRRSEPSYLRLVRSATTTTFDKGYGLSKKPVTQFQASL